MAKQFFLFKWIDGWRLGRWFRNFQKGAAKAAVAITEAVKTASEGTLVKTLSNTIDSVFHTHLATDALELIHATTIKALAVELAIQGLPDNPTEADILAFETAVVKAVSGLDPHGQSKLWTTLAAQTFGSIKEALQKDGDLSFADIVLEVEKASKNYLEDKAEIDGEDQP